MIVGKLRKSKSRYDEAYIEDLYKNIVAVDIDDSVFRDGLSKFVENRKILLIAPGASLNEHTEKIISFCEENEPLVFCANFKCSFLDVDYIFCSNIKRLDKVQDAVPTNKLIVPAAFASLEVEGANFVNTNKLGWFGSVFWDNCMLMLLHLMKDVGVEECFLAGWDGFSKNDNFVNPIMESMHQYENENGRVIEVLKRYFSSVKLNFLTPSLYKKGIQ